MKRAPTLSFENAHTHKYTGDGVGRKRIGSQVRVHRVREQGERKKMG